MLLYCIFFEASYIYRYTIFVWFLKTVSEYQNFLSIIARNQTNQTAKENLRTIKLVGSLPSSLDWRTQGYVIPVKDQVQQKETEIEAFDNTVLLTELVLCICLNFVI